MKRQTENLLTYIPKHIATDACAVCGMLHTRPNTVFCSAQCTALANTFRRRVRNSLVKLSVLDFHIEFIDGCYPKLHIPGYMTRFYPHGQTSFLICKPGTLDIRHAVLGDIWQIIEWELGFHVGQFVRETNMKPNEKVYEYRKLLEQWCSLGLQTDETHFICDECNSLYLKSGLTSWYDERTCEACSTAKIPF